MKTHRFEQLLPYELLDEQKRNGIVFLPIGSMEWHGPHMGMGMDTINAYHVSLLTAEKTGGVVMPPLFIGTETARSSEALKKVGFRGDEEIVGMDFPKNTVKSMYWPEQLFKNIVDQQLSMLVRMGYRLIVIVNGHGADNQLKILKELAQRYTKTTKATVCDIMVLFDGCGVGIGHAGLAETAIMAHLCPNGVDFMQLPPREEKLHNTDFAIVDSITFEQGGNEDFTVRYDPRDATPELGKQLVDYAVQQCIEKIVSLTKH